MKRFLSDAGLSAMSQGSATAIALLVQIVTVRSLSPAAYGSYATAAALVAIIESVFISRGGEVALNYLGRHWSDEKPVARWYWQRLIRNDWRLNWLTFALFCAFAVVLSPILHVSFWLLVALALSIPAQIGYGVSKSLFMIRGEFRTQFIFEFVYALIGGALSLLGLMLYGVYGLALANVIAALLKTLGSASIAAGWWPRAIQAVPPMGDQLHSISEIRAHNLRSVLRNAMTSTIAQVDVVLLNSFRGAEAAATYRIAKTLASLPSRVAAPLWAAVRPRLLERIRASDIAGIRRLLLAPAVVFAIAGALVTPFFALFSRELLGFVYGASYVSAAPTFQVLMLASWLLQAVTGWLSFAVVISRSKRIGVLTYGLQLAVLVVGGATVGRGSPLAMAWVVFACSATAAIVAWSAFMRATSWDLRALERMPREDSAE